MSVEGKSERYNPITGTGIPATPARANTSAIFGGSPGAIEYMFIPPSASTRPTRPSSYSDKRQSSSRESLRRSFSPVTEAQADSDECSSSISDLSECGSEADQRDKTRTKPNSLPRARRPISRSTSTRLIGVTPKPGVIKRAHSFTRGTIAPPKREPPSDVTHSESDLIKQSRRTGDNGMSKIPTKAGARSTGTKSSQLSSRIPLKRADGSTGSVGAVVKRTGNEAQGSGISVKAPVQKQLRDDSTEQPGVKAPVVKTGMTSGIPVKSSGTKIPQHYGSSKIPHLQKKSNENEPEKETQLRTHGGSEPLLKREGTGDDLQRKQDVTKSKLPRRSSIPRSSNPRISQPKTKNEIEAELNVKGKRHEKERKSPRLSPKVHHKEHHSASKIPVSEVSRSAAYSPSILNRSDSGYGDTDSVSSKEDASSEIGNEYSFSRENSKSKIPVMSRKGRVPTKNSVGTPTTHKDTREAEVTKRKVERPKHELATTDNSTPEKNGKHISPEYVSRMHYEERPATRRSEMRPDDSDESVTRKPSRNEQFDLVATSLEGTEEYDTGKKLGDVSVKSKPVNSRQLDKSEQETDLDISAPKHTSHELPKNIDHVTGSVKNHSAVKGVDALAGKKELGTKTVHSSDDTPGTTASHPGIPKDSSHNGFSNRNVDYVIAMKTQPNSLSSEKNISYNNERVIPATGMNENLDKRTGAESLISNAEKTASSDTKLAVGTNGQMSDTGPVNTKFHKNVLESSSNHIGKNGTEFMKNEFQKTGSEDMSSNIEKTERKLMHNNNHMNRHGINSEVQRNGKMDSKDQPDKSDVQKNEHKSYKKTIAEDASSNAQKTWTKSTGNNVQKTGAKAVGREKEGVHMTGGEPTHDQLSGRERAEYVDSNLRKTREENVRGNVHKIGAEYGSRNSQKTEKEVANNDENNLRKDGAEMKCSLNESGETFSKTKKYTIKNVCPGETDVQRPLGSKQSIEITSEDKEDNTENQMKHVAQESSDKKTKKGLKLEESELVMTEVADNDLPKRILTCIECRLEQNDQVEEVLGTDDADVINESDVRRYPTFISPRKSLVLCKRHEKLRGQEMVADEDEELMPTMLATAENQTSQADEVDPQSEFVPKGLNGTRLEKAKIDATTAVAKSSNISKKETKQNAMSERSNAEAQRDVGATSTGNESQAKNISQRSTAASNAHEKETNKTGAAKGCHSPLLALKRDKKYVSGENLAQAKNIEDINSALSLEWDDIGTELTPPKFSDEDDISETGSRDLSMEDKDDRRPSVKLMNTNEALDKLKMIQNLIMKEAESRSRKESAESAGKYSVGDKESGEEEEPRRKGSTYSNVEKYHINENINRKNSMKTSSQVSPTSDGKTTSPTIWDRISDSTTISQDQTTELLNETLAKLKASPQLSGHNTLSRRTNSSRSLPGSRQASKERLLSDAERPVYVYTSSWMNTSGKNSRGSSLSLCSANRSLPSSRQNLAKDPFSALKRSESASGRMDKDNGKRTESKEKFRLSNFDEMLSDDGTPDLKNQKDLRNQTNNHQIVSPVSEQPIIYHNIQLRKPRKRAKQTKKSKNTAVKMNHQSPYGASMDDLADGKTQCQCGGKKCVIS